jgi:hypothetical protein
LAPESRRLAGITCMVLPFVDASRIETPAHEVQVIEMPRGALPRCPGWGGIASETSLGPDEFAALLAQLLIPYSG